MENIAKPQEIRTFMENPNIPLGKQAFSLKNIAKPVEIHILLEKSKYFLRKTGFFFEKNYKT